MVYPLDLFYGWKYIVLCESTLVRNFILLTFNEKILKGAFVLFYFLQYDNETLIYPVNKNVDKAGT